MINLNKKIFNQIKSHALSDSPNECCGLLVEQSGVLNIFPCQNIANNTIINFKISYRDFLRASISGEIKAYYHSHAAPETLDKLSEKDKFISYNHKYPIILYLLKEDKFQIFDCEKSKYIGLKFQWGKQDCVTLVEDFYKNEFNIVIPHIERHENWDKENPYKISENFEKCGFVKITNDFKVGDLIVIRDHAKHPSHLMIYLGNNQVLHQRTHSYSMIEIYNDRLVKITEYVLRHKLLC